jgi:hypothetical protein
VKRGWLRRKTPLRSGSQLRRTPLKPRPKPNRLDGDERAHVLIRDGDCIMRILVREGYLQPHEVDDCRGPFEQPIRPYPNPLTDLEYNHVKPAAQMGGARPSDRRWACAACHRHNAVTHAVSKHVGLIRIRLARLEEQGRL